MGLDQYAYTSRVKEENDSTTDVDKPTWMNDESTELAYWRKHPNLQGWMEQLWHKKNQGKLLEHGFNGVEVELTWEDIDLLEDAITNFLLPPTMGSFFGNDSDEFYKVKDLEFCENARLCLLRGQQVFYNSSW